MTALTHQSARLVGTLHDDTSNVAPLTPEIGGTIAVDG